MILLFISFGKGLFNWGAEKSNRNSNTYQRYTYEDTQFKPIRIFYDFQYFNKTTDDPQRCTTIGQNIHWNDTVYTCHEDDLITNEQIQAYQTTFQNAINYITDLVKVNPYQKHITFPKKDDCKVIQNGPTITNYDLYLIVFLRPFNLSSLISAVNYYDVDGQETYRPITGAIYLNAANIPKNSSDIDTDTNHYFFSILKSIFNIMVMSPSLYKHFHTARTNIPYEEIICEFRKYNRTFRILVSPYAHNFGTRHYKVEKFEGDDSSCPSGIVLELSLIHI